jgi:hypothetical protein
VPERKSQSRLLILAMSSVAIALFLIGRGVLFPSHTSVLSSTDARAHLEVMRETSKWGVSNGSHSIALRSSGAAQFKGGPEAQAIVANCAKGFVRRGSMCEVNTTQITLSAASNVAEQNSVRPPKRE